MKVQNWATNRVHDRQLEHWRVTGLLAKASHATWNSLANLKPEELDKLPQKVRDTLPTLYRQLELTDYFLSGLAGVDKEE